LQNTQNVDAVSMTNDEFGGICCLDQPPCKGFPYILLEHIPTLMRVEARAPHYLEQECALFGVVSKEFCYVIHARQSGNLSQRSVSR